MKKLVAFFLCALAGLSTMAQNLDQINDMMDKGKFREAKEAIDKYLQDPKKANNAEALYFKGRVYNSLSRDKSAQPSELFGLRSDAFDAFKRNQELDKKDVFMSLETHTSYLDLYLGMYDLGVQEFNNKNYDAAFNAFQKALEIEAYTLAKKYTYSQIKFSALDTSLVMNAAAAGIQAKREDEAMQQYKKITDANVSSDDYRDVYVLLAEYYNKKNDAASLQALVEKGKRLFPKDDYWADVEIRAVSKNGDKDALYAKYESMLAQNPSSFLLAYNYSIEMYNDLYGKDARKQGNLEFSNKLTESIKKAIALEKNDNTATMLMANHLFNMSADLLNASNNVKGNKPDDLKKKASLKTAATKSMDDCIVYSESVMTYTEALPEKSNGHKANYKIAMAYLSDIYNIKGNKVKAAVYTKKSKEADKW